MSVSVLKYGGSSVSNFDQIKDIARYIQKRVDQGDQCIVVVSAMGKTTDQLLASVASLTPDPKNEDLALLLSTGEQQSVSYLSLVLNDLGVKSKSLTGYQAGIKTSGHVLKSKIKTMDPGLFQDKLKDYDCLVVAGFQGVNQDSDMTTLGRGGSDTTAVAIAASLKAPCEIYTDVPGVFATDPRVFPQAPKLDLITYEEMMELSALGAGVLESRSVEIAKNYGVKIYLGKTLSDQGGTWVVAEEELFEKKAVTGVALDMDMSHITMTYPDQNINLLRRLFEFLQKTKLMWTWSLRLITTKPCSFPLPTSRMNPIPCHTGYKAWKKTILPYLTWLATIMPKFPWLGPGCVRCPESLPKHLWPWSTRLFLFTRPPLQKLVFLMSSIVRRQTKQLLACARLLE